MIPDATKFEKCRSFYPVYANMKKFSDDQIIDEFIDDRIKQNKTGFYDTIKKKKTKTFSLLKPVKRLCVKCKEVIIQPDRSLFARLFAIREKTWISIREQLRHSLGPAAWSLARPGCIYKSMQSKLLNAIERIETVDEIPSKSAIIYDGMCIMHQLPKYLETFRDLSSFLLKRITSNDSDHVLFIIDQC